MKTLFFDLVHQKNLFSSLIVVIFGQKMVILEKCAECAKVCVLETNRNICVREKIDQNSKTQQPCDSLIYDSLLFMIAFLIMLE